VVAVYRVAYESLERVRQGGGPVLIEAKPYRQTKRRKPGAANAILSPTWNVPRGQKLFILAGKIGSSKSFRKNLTPPPKRREKCNDRNQTRALG
jgi:hypothetical protein